MERKWGIGTLPNRVPHSLAERFAKAKVNLNAAIQASNVALVKQKATNLTLGWELLDQAAAKQGHRPQDAQRRSQQAEQVVHHGSMDPPETEIKPRNRRRARSR